MPLSDLGLGPKCQSLKQAKWIAQRLERLLPVHYFHVVFTLPSELRPLARRNQRAVYKLLFESVQKTLLSLGEDPRHLGAQLAYTAVLHTWTRTLEFHPHLHCIVTGGGLSPDGTRWIPARQKYLFPLQVMSSLFRGVFLDGLKRDIDKGTIRADGIDVQKLLSTLYRLDWVVYAKRPFGGPEQVFKYLGRYTHRVGISNQRLISMSDEGVCFATKNGEQITLPPQEFIRRFLLHVLPPGFVKIRHYGLWASGSAAGRLGLARSLLPPPADATPSVPPAPVASVSDDDPDTIDQDEQTWQQRLLALVGLDVTRCPRCLVGRMVRRALHEDPSSTATPIIALSDTS